MSRNIKKIVTMVATFFIVLIIGIVYMQIQNNKLNDELAKNNTQITNINIKNNK